MQPTWPAVLRDASANPTATICNVASSNYTAVFGVSEPGIGGEGVFFRNSGVSMKDILDGSSSTFLVGERTHYYCQATWVGASDEAASSIPLTGSPASPEMQIAAGMILGHTQEGGFPMRPGYRVQQLFQQALRWSAVRLCRRPRAIHIQNY